MSLMKNYRSQAVSLLLLLIAAAISSAVGLVCLHSVTAAPEVSPEPAECAENESDWTVPELPSAETGSAAFSEPYAEWLLIHSHESIDDLPAELREEGDYLAAVFENAESLLYQHRFYESWVGFQDLKSLIAMTEDDASFRPLFWKAELYTALIEFLCGQTLSPMARLESIGDYLHEENINGNAVPEDMILYRALNACLFPEAGRFDLAFSARRIAYEWFEDLETVPVHLRLLLCEADIRYSILSGHKPERTDAETLLSLLEEWREQAEADDPKAFMFWETLIRCRAAETYTAYGDQEAAYSILQGYRSYGSLNKDESDTEGRLFLKVRLETAWAEYDRAFLKQSYDARRSLTEAADCAKALVLLEPDDDVYLEEMYRSLAVRTVFRLAKQYEEDGQDETASAVLEELFPYLDAEYTAFDTYLTGCRAIRTAMELNERLNRVESHDRLTERLEYYGGTFHRRYTDRLPFAMPAPCEVKGRW